MSRDWTPDELKAASDMMKAAGNLSYEEFCKELDKAGFLPKAPASPTGQLQPPSPREDKYAEV